MTTFADQTTRTYGSIVELGEYLRTAESAAGAGNSSQGSRDNSWDLGVGFAGALGTALDGGWWEDGAKDMMKAQAKAAEYSREVFAPEPEYDVTGAHLDVDEYLSGSPECWEMAEERETEARVISIGFSAFMCANVPAYQAVNRGAALLTLIDEIESNGDRVELWAGFHQYEGREKTDGRVLIKDAMDDWSPSSVAFAMCHPAFSRRLGFRWLEVHEDTYRMTKRGYGYGMSHKDMDCPYDIYFGYFHKGPSWTSPESALRTISEDYHYQLKQNEGERT